MDQEWNCKEVQEEDEEEEKEEEEERPKVPDSQTCWNLTQAQKSWVQRGRKWMLHGTCAETHEDVCEVSVMAFGAWTSKMAKIMDPILPILSILEYWAIILGSFGGPGRCLYSVAWSPPTPLPWPSGPPPSYPLPCFNDRQTKGIRPL